MGRTLKPGLLAALLAAPCLPCAPAYAQAGSAESYRWPTEYMKPS